MSIYNNFVGSIMVKDPTRIAQLVLAETSEQATLCILVDHYYDQKTIPLAEAERLKELITSPDKENMEVAKVLLQQKYHILR